jgi:predicted nucleotidyltransferase
MLGAVRQFVREKVAPAGGRDRKDVFLEPYFSWAADVLAGAVAPGDGDAQEVPRYEPNRRAGSTGDVDFWTSRPVREVERSHLNYVVADTDRWEQSAAFHLDRDERVIAFAKNAGLGFAIPYAHRGDTREYLPDFLVRLSLACREVGTLILETKGYDPAGAAKVAGAQRWVAAVNTEGSHGRWAFRLVSTPSDVPAALGSAARELAAPPGSGWRVALDAFVRAARQAYGARLDRVVLCGSHARGDAVGGSDVDALVVLDRCEDFWAEFDRVKAIAAEVSIEHDAVISALPVGREEFERGGRPLLVNARREGRTVS